MLPVEPVARMPKRATGWTRRKRKGADMDGESRLFCGGLKEEEGGSDPSSPSHPNT